MPRAVDPTYPFFPIVAIVSSAMMLLVLCNRVIRQSWNLGVASLCFWLFVENLTVGINTIIWADNADIKFYVYCDIVSRMQLITLTVGPMATLIITRRLYLITSLQSVDLPNQCAKRKDAVIEWTLCLAIPLLVAGPFYYVVQGARFSVYEGLGCTNFYDLSWLGVLLINSWGVIFPTFSLIVYYPRVVLILHRQGRDMNRFLQSNGSISRTNYLRLLALASIDLFLTLPLGIAAVVLSVKMYSPGSLPFYDGWAFVHEDWEPFSVSYAELKEFGTLSVVRIYFDMWGYIFAPIAIFALFGINSEARASYWRTIHVITGWLGRKPRHQTHTARSTVERMEFERAMDVEIGSRPSLIDSDPQTPELDVASSDKGEFNPRHMESISCAN